LCDAVGWAAGRALVGTNLIHREKCVISRDVSENMPNFTENSRKEFQKFTGPTDVISRCYAQIHGKFTEGVSEIHGKFTDPPN